MPTYEYECKNCGERFEVFQSIKAAPLRRAECSSCGEIRPVRRLISTGGAILFKGAGFYQTDYRSEGYKKAAESDKASSSSTVADKAKSGSAPETPAKSPKKKAAKESPSAK